MHNVGTVPTFKMHNVVTVPTFKMHNVGTELSYATPSTTIKIKNKGFFFNRPTPMCAEKTKILGNDN